LSHKRERFGGPQVPQIYRQDVIEVHPTASHRGPEFHEPQGSPLLRHLATLRRRKWLLIAVTLTVLVLATLDLYTMTPLYRASARLQLDPEALNVLPYQALDQSGQRMASQQFLMTQLEKIRSLDLARSVVDKLNLNEDSGFQARQRAGVVKRLGPSLRRLPSRLLSGGRSSESSIQDDDAAAATALARRDGAAAKLRAGIGVRLVGATRLVEVSYISPRPETAARIANAVAREFITLHLEGRYDATTQASDFLQSELTELQTRVEQSEEALLAYGRNKAIVNLNDKQTIIRKKLADLTDELTRVEGELIEQKALAQVIAAGQFPDVLRDQRIRDLEAQLYAHEAELAQTSSRYGPEWPSVKALTQKISTLRQQLAQSRRSALSAARQTYSLTRGHFDRLQAATAEQGRIVEQLDNDSIQYNILKREAESNQQLYKGLLLRLKEANVEAGLESSNIQVVEEAIIPRAAAVPEKMKGLSRALMMGLLLGLTSIGLAEMLDRSIKTPDDVQEYCGLPTLGVVPPLSADDGGPSNRKPSRFRRTVDKRSFLATGGKEFLRGRQWEAYRSLRTSLLLSASEHPPQVLLVTSPGPAEGKTTTATNLALAFAQTGERTLLLEFDLRRPVLADSLGLYGGSGVSTYLSGNDDLGSLVAQTSHENLYVVPAGPTPPNPPELISSDRMVQGIEFARKHFVHVVIDSPPSLELSDSRLLSRHADGVIVVARAGHTPKPALRKASEQLLGVGALVLGVVLNDFRFEHADYGYYGGYGNYYGEEDSSSQRSEKQSA